MASIQKPQEKHALNYFGTLQQENSINLILFNR